MADENGRLGVLLTANQDTPVSQGKTPILVFDVREHTYYLKYRNARPDYIKALFDVINWEKVAELYLKATK